MTDPTRRAPGLHFDRIEVTYPRAEVPALAGVTIEAQPARVTAVARAHSCARCCSVSR
jgi:hypothetical protein